MSKRDAMIVPEEIIVDRPKGFWGWWLSCTAPPRTAQTLAGPQLREKLRKAELVGYFLFILTLFVFFDLILALSHPLSLLVILGFVLFLVGVAYLNRKGRTQWASSLLIGGILLSLMYVLRVPLALKPGVILLPSYMLFVYPIVIGSLFLPRKLIFPLTFLVVLFICLDLTLGNHSVDVQAAKQTQGVVSLLLPSCVLIVVTAFVCWFGIGNIERAVLRADHAEELAAAQKDLALQAQMMVDQNERLQSGIVQILSVHKEAATGNYAVRAPVHTDDAIWQIGRSLNNLLARYERLAQDSQELEQTRADIERIARAIEQARQGGGIQYPRCSSPLGKRLLYAIGSSSSRGR